MSDGPEADESPVEVEPESDHEVRPANERRASRLIGLCFILAILASLGFMVLYSLGGSNELYGILFAIIFGGIGMGLVMWGKYLFRPEIVTEEREPHVSEEAAFEEAQGPLVLGTEQIVRRTFLVRLLAGAAGVFGLAALFPLGSLGPFPGANFVQTAWRRGLRLVDENGTALRVGDVPVNGMVTVFPEGHIGDAQAQSVLVRVEPTLLALPDGRNRWAPEGNVCYSKLCTHAGCPVGLFLAQFHELQCPCHFSTFNVLEGAKVEFGPAGRPLPQLPIYADAEGYLRAESGFTGPPGPGFWNQPGSSS